MLCFLNCFRNQHAKLEIFRTLQHAQIVEQTYPLWTDRKPTLVLENHDKKTTLLHIQNKDSFFRIQIIKISKFHQVVMVSCIRYFLRIKSIFLFFIIIPRVFLWIGLDITLKFEELFFYELCFLIYEMDNSKICDM